MHSGLWRISLWNHIWNHYFSHNHRNSYANCDHEEYCEIISQNSYLWIHIKIHTLELMIMKSYINMNLFLLAKQWRISWNQWNSNHGWIHIKFIPLNLWLWNHIGIPKYEFIYAFKAVKNILKSMQFKSWLNSYQWIHI